MKNAQFERNLKAVDCAILVDFLTLPILFSLLFRGVFWRRCAVYYLQASPLATPLMQRANRLTWLPIQFLFLKDPYFLDSHFNRLFETNVTVSRRFHAALEARLDAILNRHLHDLSVHHRAIVRTNLLKSWVREAKLARHLSHCLPHLASGLGIPPARVEMVLSCGWLLRAVPDLGDLLAGVTLRRAPFSEGSFFSLEALRPLLFLGRHLRNVMSARRGVVPRTHAPGHRVGTTIFWPLTGRKPRNFCWWFGSALSGWRHLALFERRDLPLDGEGAATLNRMEIERVAIRRRVARGDDPPLVRFPWLHVGVVLNALALLLRALLCGPVRRAVLRRAAWQLMKGAELGGIYQRCGIKALFHFQEDDVDFQSLAMERIGGIRVGFHWSSFDGPGGSTVRTHHVFFLWGAHDAKVALDGGSISPHILMGGCPLVDAYDDRFDEEARAAAARIRAKGAKVVVAVFDTTSKCYDFYRALFQWVVEEPRIGILLKCKRDLFFDIMLEEGPGEVAKAARAARATGRFERLDGRAFPTVAARVCDFSLGMGTTSTVAVCAIDGHRVLYLDYEGLDKPLLKPYATFSSLGPNRCTFPNPEALRVAMAGYMDHPERWKTLGDATPIVDRLDPFRDGKAGARIGDYVADFIAALETGQSREQALKTATGLYAKKWGRDKVLRGLDAA